MTYPTEHIFWSYRLAKIEVSAEKRGLGRLTFANFESDLVTHLRELRHNLRGPTDLFRGVSAGKVWVCPKRIDTATAAENGSAIVRIPEAPHNHGIASMHVRIILEPDPRFATSEIIWLRTFGPALDALLSDNCRGNRLELRKSHTEPPHIPATARRAYRYWAPAYFAFRDNAISSARRLLSRGPSRRCILTTLDLASYYDNIDPSFLLSDTFVGQVEAAASHREIKFARSDYVSATAQLLEVYAQFRREAGDLVGMHRTIGIPIGALTSRLIANVALANLDRLIASHPSVRYYARYVDDIIVVEEPKGESFRASATVQRLLPLDPTRTTSDNITIDNIRIERPGSDFTIQAAKLRIFDLNGEQGLEYLGAIKSDMQRLSSERRRFMEPWGAELDHTVAASAKAEPVRALREADVLSLRKLAVTTVSDKVATAAAMLNREDARHFSRKYLGRVGRLATDWSRWVDLIDVSLRILGSALMCGDETTANEIIDAILSRAHSLDSENGNSFRVFWGNSDIDEWHARRNLRRWVEARLIEVICGASTFGSTGFTIVGLKAVTDGVILQEQKLGAAGLLEQAKRLAAADLRLADRETDHDIGTMTVRHSEQLIQDIELELASDANLNQSASQVQRFVSASKRIRDDVFGRLSVVEILLMYRPPSYFDILFRWLRAEQPVGDVLSVVNAIRGTRNSSIPMKLESHQLKISPPEAPRISTDELERTRLVLGNLCTEEDWGKKSLTSPCLTIERQNRLARILNQALDSSRLAKSYPTMLILPELSLPRRWARQVCQHLNRAAPHLSIVAGLEYDVVKKTKTVFNEVLAYVPRPFHSAAAWIWTKRRPAHGEGIDLREGGYKFGVRRKKWRFVVMSSEHGSFIPLICSELLEVDTRARLLGAVDIVLVPAWNRDTTSFEAMVQSASLELHGFVCVANNGVFSDCRIRAPYSEPWRREVCRLIARNQNEVVSADVPIGSLRQFQSNPEGFAPKNLWKPLPPGYVWRKS